MNGRGFAVDMAVRNFAVILDFVLPALISLGLFKWPTTCTTNLVGY